MGRFSPIVLILFGLTCRSAQAAPWVERQIRVPLVSKATVYVSARPTTNVVLFISGDGGWNKGVVDMARRKGSRIKCAIPPRRRHLPAR